MRNEIKPGQTPVEGILLHKDYGKCKFYKVPCECGNGDDEITFDVEADDYGVTAHFYVKVKSNWWDSQTNAWTSFTKRVKQTWDLWVHGYVEYESWTLMSRQQTLNFAATLESAVKDVEVFHAEYIEKCEKSKKDKDVKPMV